MSAKIRPAEMTPVQTFNDSPSYTTSVEKKVTTAMNDIVARPANAFSRTIGTPMIKKVHSLWYVGEGDTLYSKTKRFIKADRYNCVDDRWSRLMIYMSIIPAILAITTFIIWFINGRPALKYTSSTGSEEVLEKMNNHMRGIDILKYAVTVTSFIAAVMHIRTLYRYNDFQNDTRFATVARRRPAPSSTPSDGPSELDLSRTL